MNYNNKKKKLAFYKCGCTVDSAFCTSDIAVDFARVGTRASAIARVSGHGLQITKDLRSTQLQLG